MPEIEFSIDEQGIGLLIVNRPEVRNALNWQAQQAFADAIDQAGKDPDLRALLITGAGGAFLAGGDIKELNEYPTREDGIRLVAVMGDALNELENLPIITIAAINGPARGGGAEVALACDLRIMAAKANIAFVHARLGLIPGWGGGERLLRLIGPGWAMELTATARVVDSDEARLIGLVNRVVAGEELLETAYQTARQIAQNSPQSIAAYKQLFRQYPSLTPQQARQLERETFVELWDTEERRQHFKQANDKAP